VAASTAGTSASLVPSAPRILAAVSWSPAPHQSLVHPGGVGATFAMPAIELLAGSINARLE
jgi:hypothetical protein